MLHALKPQHN